MVSSKRRLFARKRDRSYVMTLRCIQKKINSMKKWELWNSGPSRRRLSTPSDCQCSDKHVNVTASYFFSGRSRWGSILAPFEMHRIIFEQMNPSANSVHPMLRIVEVNSFHRWSIPNSCVDPIAYVPITTGSGDRHLRRWLFPWNDLSQVHLRSSEPSHISNPGRRLRSQYTLVSDRNTGLIHSYTTVLFRITWLSITLVFLRIRIRSFTPVYDRLRWQ